MSGIMQDLHTVGLNPFAAVLLAESLLKSPLAEMTVGKPQGFFMPINRTDCPGWAGVRITVEAVLPAESLAQPAAEPVQPTSKWAIEYQNETGPDDGGFWEWWEVSDGEQTFKADTEAGAKMLLTLLSAHKGETP